MIEDQFSEPGKTNPPFLCQVSKCKILDMDLIGQDLTKAAAVVGSVRGIVLFYQSSMPVKCGLFTGDGRNKADIFMLF